MCKVIDFTEVAIRKADIYWDISVDSKSSERIGILKNPANEQIMIYLTVQNFEHISDMRDQALKELKQKIFKGQIEYA